MEKAVIYSRVSTKDQDYERQIVSLRKYAKDNNLEVDEWAIFAEKISGTIKGKDRKEFTLMSDYIETNEIKHVLVWELSRLGRSMIDVVNIVNDFSEKGVTVHIKESSFISLNDDGEKDSMDMIKLSVLSGFAEIERKLIVQRSKSGLDRHIRNGGAKSIPPFGFKNVDKKLVKDEEEGKIVRLIFKLYGEGLSTAGIAKQLNSKGKKSKKNGRWIGKSVNDILKNPIYYGKRRHRDEFIDVDPDGNSDPYISEDRWKYIQQLLRGNSSKKDNSKNNVNILQGRIKCGKCGRGMFLHRNNKNNVYVCLGKYKSHIPKGEEACDCRDVNIDNLNSLIYHTLNKIGPVSSDEAWLEKVQLKLDEANAELDNAMDEIDVAETRMVKIRKLLIDDIFTKAEYQEEKAMQEAVIKKAESTIKYWTNEVVSYESYLDKNRPDYEIVVEDGIKYAIPSNEPKDYSHLNHYSDLATTLKSQIQNAVAGVYIYNEPFILKKEKVRIERELKRARREAERELKANPPADEEMDTIGDWDYDPKDFAMVNLLKSNFMEDRTKSVYNTRRYKELFPNPQSYPTLVTIKLVNGKEYNYILPSLYKKYIDEDDLKVKDLTHKIDI